MSVGPSTAQSVPEEGERVDELLAELAEPGQEDWRRIENEIAGIWSRSGSRSMDLLLMRGKKAIEEGRIDEAVEHFSALTDHAPDFAEGWNARATAFFLMEEYSLSIMDVERTLALNPDHFGALSGLATMFEIMDEPDLALRALREVQRINPNRPETDDAILRLERSRGEIDL